MTRTYLMLAAALTVGAANAQPTINGSLAGDESFYGSALSIQDTRTQFGDANNPDPILSGGGSEIDQVFATVSGDRLYVLVTGNLEDNFNKLNVFIDSEAGGVNTLDGAALPAAVDSFCCGGLEPPRGGNTDGEGALQRMNGLGFDTGFDADHLLIFTHGGESVPGVIDFNAFSSHYADLTDGVNGTAAALGMQLAPRGEPRLLRAPASNPLGDYNDDGVVDAADYTRYRDTLGSEIVLPNNEVAGNIGQGHYDQWADNYGAVGNSGGIDDFAFKPEGNPGNTDDLVSDFTLANLGQGELIDRDYALSDGGCTDDTGAGCLAREFEFALDVDPAELGTNDSSHRNFDNVVDLRMALDNSNIAGVLGGGADFELVDGEDDPENVTTGVEFSIPLDQIGDPTGDIGLMVFINGGGHDFLSNQVAGALGPGGGGVIRATEIGESGGNLGTAFFGDTPGGSFKDIPGNQFITLSQPASTAIPEPTAIVMAVFAAVGLAGVRR